MHTPYPNIEEDMEFTTVLIVKQKLEELISIALFGHIKQILSYIKKFYRFAHL
jgi:hypothetical protein